MNSRSRRFDHCKEPCPPPKKCFNECDCECKCNCMQPPKCCNQAHCTPGHPLPDQSSLFACGQGSGVAIPIPTVTNPTFNPLPIASVTIDSTCLCNPSIKIDFDALINYQALITLGATPVLGSPFTVTFQLSKICGSGSKIALGTWDFAFGILALAVNVTNSFSFSHCECNVCPGCCVYTVEIVRVSSSVLSSTGVLTTESAAIRSSSISATAISH
ncbi:DUF4489 domain-containing protein [Clostridium hydrogeniformans]|uniref:DUF4489 domain-containing protein n=1 Tax=Clostridium hydrogeniformans TaxID=349933 RepID=UPI000487811F|nr:DUF4489 domain-containing protein [Clostridium hydrogeniformans]